MKFNRQFNHRFETIGATRVPESVGDRYYGQDMIRDHRYLQGIAGRIYLNSLGVSSALLSGGNVTIGSSVTKVNITAATGIADFDIEVSKDTDGWSVPTTTEISQIPVLVEMPAQTDFLLSGATLNGSTINYLKLRYKEEFIQYRVKQYASSSYNYSIGDSYVLSADASAPTSKDIVLATFVGNGSTILTITQNFPIGPAGQQMAECFDYGFPYDGTDAFLGEKLRIAGSRIIGETVISSMPITAVSFNNAKSSAHPTYDQYAPFIDRSTNHDLSISNYPKLAILKNTAIRILGVVDFPVTVSSSTITFGNSTQTDLLLKALVQDATATGWLNSNQVVNAPADYSTTSTQRCVTITNTEYAITNINLIARTMEVIGTPAQGSQTACIFPYRIAGSSNIRLHALSGFVPCTQGDYDGEVIDGLRSLDRLQGDYHANLSTIGVITALNPGGGSGAAVSQTGGSFYYNASPVTGAPYQAPSAGVPRVGKTTNPRMFGQYIYTFAGVYL